VCEPQIEWETYTVQPGNTLFAIALAVGSNISELREANCLTDVDNITAGDVLYVPRLPEQPINGGLSTPLPDFETGAGPVGCTNPGVVISSPLPGAGLVGVVTVSGTASIAEFDYYKIEVRPDYSPVYNFYGRYESPVVNGALATLNTELFDNGLHWVQLTVVDATGNYPVPCAIPVIFR
jgi:murein DD-endopeptidase MepM/ murein hydrolase activator NlpD